MIKSSPLLGQLAGGGQSTPQAGDSDLVVPPMLIGDLPLREPLVIFTATAPVLRTSGIATRNQSQSGAGTTTVTVCTLGQGLWELKIDLSAVADIDIPTGVGDDAWCRVGFGPSSPGVNILTSYQGSGAGNGGRVQNKIWQSFLFITSDHVVTLTVESTVGVIHSAQVSVMAHRIF